MGASRLVPSQTDSLFGGRASAAQQDASESARWRPHRSRRLLGPKRVAGNVPWLLPRWQSLSASRPGGQVPGGDLPARTLAFRAFREFGGGLSSRPSNQPRSPGLYRFRVRHGGLERHDAGAPWIRRPARGTVADWDARVAALEQHSRGRLPRCAAGRGPESDRGHRSVGRGDADLPARCR